LEASKTVLVPVVNLIKWKRKVQDARRRGYFTQQNKDDAGEWTCCALGERDTMCDKSIDETKYNAAKSKNRLSDANNTVKDYMLMLFSDKAYSLGMGFHNAVVGNNFDDAKDILNEMGALPKDEFYNK